ncbi:MAG: translation initiation factor IF-3, partial [Propionibacteriaceae bacterium]|nr:translation initiation factor IF-3 [Propionibacteriaceae bacterium]
LRPKIDDHDYETKRGHVQRFLRAGDKVKITIMFRGREQSRPELGIGLLKRLSDDVVADGIVEQVPRQEGRNMHMVLSPTRKKSEARAEEKAVKDAKLAAREADAQAEKVLEAELRVAAAEKAKDAPKKKRGPADNMDPDVDL